MSLLNWGGGLSAAGSSIADFAGKAGIELQKVDLEKQQTILADQLATTRESTLQGQQQAATHQNLVETQASEDTRSANQIAAENTRSGNTLTAEGARQDKALAAEAPLRAAQAKYYSNVKGQNEFADSEGFAMKRDPDGNLIYDLDPNGNKQKLSKVGTPGAGKNPEGVRGAIADDLQKQDPTLSRADALAAATPGANKSPQVDAAKERLAVSQRAQDLKARIDALNNFRKGDPPVPAVEQLDVYRQKLGLPARTAAPDANAAQPAAATDATVTPPPVAPPAGPKTYKTPADVTADFKSNKLSYKDAAQILQSQFGIKSAAPSPQ